MPYLVVANGPDLGRRYPLDGPRVLGRHPECDIVIDVGAVSRQHARLLTRGPEFYVEDLKSRNGTFVNGSRISEETALQHGDRIRICDVEFSFLDGANAKTNGDLNDGSTYNVFMDEAKSGATIMSKLDVSTRGGVQLTASPEAKLEAVLEINQNLAKCLALDDVLPGVLNSLFRIFVQADRGFIVLEQDDELIPRWTKMRREDDAQSIRISKTIIREVIESKEAILSADAATDERFEMSQSIADFRIRSMMCAPLLDSEGNAFGALQIDTLDQRKRFEPEDLEVLAAVAAQAGIAIHNASLYEAALQQKAVERDLELAHDVQRSFLPRSRPEFPGYNFYDFYEPAHFIGGDYYDYIPLPDGRLAIVVADVVGHGVAAALLMSKFSAEARFSLAATDNPAVAVTQLNERICGLHLDRFVTLILVVLDPKSARVSIVNGGHMAPFWRRKDGNIEEPGEEEAGLPIGVMEGMDYEQATIELEPGDTLYLFTDGLNEAMDPEGNCYGLERMRELITRGPADMETSSQQVLADIHEFVAGGNQTDDMCLVTIKRQ